MNLFQRIMRKKDALAYLVYTPINKMILSFNAVEGMTNLKTNGLVYIRNQGKIYIGNKVRINSSPNYNPIGHQRTNIQVLGGNLIIGDDVGMSHVSITCTSEIRIGDRVLLGSGVKIFDTDFHALNGVSKTRAPIEIGNDVFIGTGAIILKGVKIGNGAVIGAGAVITRNVPENEIWAGNPAKRIREYI